MDYLNPRLGRSSIPLIRRPATTTPYKGQMLFNPSGPGGSGVTYIQEIIALALQVIGSNYDIVSWDPRGTGFSIPIADCNLTSDLTGTKIKRESDRIHGPDFAQSYFISSYARIQEAGKECAASIGAPDQAGPHMSTAIVCRDLVSIVDAFVASEDGGRCKSQHYLITGV